MDGFLKVSGRHGTPGNTLSESSPSHSLRMFLCAFPPHILNLDVNSRPLGWPRPISRLSFWCTQFSHNSSANLPSQWDISSGPLWGGTQLRSGLTSYHVCPTGTDLARTPAALGAMNHHFIFLGHMWVKLSDVNHTLPASVCSRRASGCHSALATPSPYTQYLV